MGPVALAYSIAVLVMFALCAAARLISPDADRLARAASWVLLLTGMSRLVGYFTDPPLSLVHYPAQDLLMTALAFGWWQVRGERWAWLLGFCFLFQLSLHGWFWWAGDVRNLYIYIVANNAAFVAELLILGLTGGGYVAVWARDRLRMLRGRAGGVLGYGATTWTSG